MKRDSIKKRSYSLFTLALAILCLSQMMSCEQKKTQNDGQESNTDSTATVQTADNEATTTPEVPYMAAPKIEVNANGLITLTDCPQTDERLKVTVAENNEKADVYYDGELIQTVKGADDAPLATDGQAPVHFMDANFDGYTDIFLGRGESRTYSSLLIWNPDTKQFKNIGTLGEPSLQGIMLDPSTQSVYQGGSNSWCSFNISRSQWKGQNLEEVESMDIISDPSQYGANNVSAKFTVYDSDHDYKTSSETLEDLPKNWQDAVKAYGLE